MLRLNNVSIWNIVDLKRDFSPIELYRQKEEYLRFVKVHCMILTTRLSGGEDDSYEAYYLTKEFWYNVLSDKRELSSDDSDTLIWDFLQNKIEEEASSDSEKKKIREEIEKELSDAQVVDKINYIQANCNCFQSETKGHIAMLLLAICELAEVDARDCKYEASCCEKSEVVDQSGKIEFLNVDESIANKTKTIELKSSKQVYKFFAYDDKTLNTNALINTVRIEALAGKNKYDTVMIEFYNSEEVCVAKTSLRPGEHRYMNVSQGRFIRFLPAINIENGCCVHRVGYVSQNTKIKTENEQPRTISKFEPTCFTALGKNAGVIFVRDGKIVTDYCKIHIDYRTRLVLEMLLAGLNVVEIKVISNAVKVLTTEGKLYSIMTFNGDEYAWKNISLKSPEAERCLTISEKLIYNENFDNKDGVLERVTSSTGTETAELMRSGECKIKFQ